MATYRVYDNILLKLENVFLRVESEVDREITSLFAEHTKINLKLSDLKTNVEVLNSLKRSFELYSDNELELQNLNRSLFKILCDKQVLLRFLQEKELLLRGYLVSMPDRKIPTVIQLNKELKIRKRLQEIELLSGFLAEDSRFSSFKSEIEKANDIFDLGVESGANDKLESVILLFQNYFEKVSNILDLDESLIDDFKDFRSQILLQANNVCAFTVKDTDTFNCLQKTLRNVREERINLEHEIDQLLYQFAMLQSGKKIIISEIKTMSGELESVLFKEYAIKQKIQELKQYKVELTNQRDNFMKDPTVDGYTEAVQQLEFVENRFRRLMLHKNFEKPSLVTRFFAANMLKTERQFQNNEQSPSNEILLQVLQSSYISSQDKVVILRLSKPSKLINAHSGQFFYQRTSKTHSLKNLENSFKKLQMHELH